MLAPAFSDKDQVIALIDFYDIALAEEDRDEDDNEYRNKQKHGKKKGYFPLVGLLTCSQFTTLDNCVSSHKTYPFLEGSICPIYILQRVLRI